MLLLGSSTAPTPEFASISLLLKPEPSNELPATFGEPLLIASPLSTVSSSCATDALTELHTHLTCVLKACSVANDTAIEETVSIELLRNDEQLLAKMQSFRPIAASGLGLYYRLVQDSSVLSTFSSLSLASHQNNNAVAKIDPSKLYGVVICVGVSGLALAQCSSSIDYTLSQRMNDCINVLTKVGDKDLTAAKSVLSSFLLVEDECRKTNAMIEAKHAIVLPETEDSAKGVSLAMRKSRRVSVKPGLGHANSSTELVLPIANHSTTADLARNMIDRLTLLSVAEADTFLRKYEISGHERRANLDLTGGSKSRFRRRKGDTRDADLDNFDYKGPKREVVESRVSRFDEGAFRDDDSQQQSVGMQLRSSKKDTRTKGGSVPVLSASRTDAGYGRTRRTTGRLQFDDDGADASRTEASSVESLNRVQVNIALNEDLSCSYKHSQLSSCSVEGVVQVQVKANLRSVVPFHLLLRDPASHIATLQENRTFADDATEELVQDNEDEYADRKFTIRVAKSDNYFPVLRYKCSPELRPVPIRVQTRVKADGGVCRVALQISSNPNNSTSLTDLTIIMNVPEVVVGETLVTQPAGGVWDESKGSVIWCVSELGAGEKFQLQARFETEKEVVASQQVTFPVMVRCQCLFAQLSDLELEVRDIPDTVPAEVTMKVARRFRLSHREKS